jgi:hypothetical protein
MFKNIRLPEPLRKRIDAGVRDPSAIVQDDIERYYSLLDLVGKEMTGHFSIEESSHLCDVFRSTAMDTKRLASWPSFLAWDVEDVEKYEKLGAGAGIETERLIDKLERLTVVQAIWVWHSIRLFWETPSQGGPRNDALKTIFRTG